MSWRFVVLPDDDGGGFAVWRVCPDWFERGACRNDLWCACFQDPQGRGWLHSIEEVCPDRPMADRLCASLEARDVLPGGEPMAHGDAFRRLEAQRLAPRGSTARWPKPKAGTDDPAFGIHCVPQLGVWFWYRVTSGAARSVVFPPGCELAPLFESRAQALDARAWVVGDTAGAAHCPLTDGQIVRDSLPFRDRQLSLLTGRVLP